MSKLCEVCYRLRLLSLHNGLNMCRECKESFLDVDRAIMKYVRKQMDALEQEKEQTNAEF